MLPSQRNPGQTVRPSRSPCRLGQRLSRELSRRRSELETEIAVARTGEHAPLRFETCPRRTYRPMLGPFEREVGELRASKYDGRSLMGDLGLQFGALTTATQPGEAPQALLGGA